MDPIFRQFNFSTYYSSGVLTVISTSVLLKLSRTATVTQALGTPLVSSGVLMSAGANGGFLVEFVLRSLFTFDVAVS